MTTIRLQQQRLSIDEPAISLQDSLELDGDDNRMQAFSQRYQQIRRQNQARDLLIELGRDIYDWLNQCGWLTDIIKSLPMPPWTVEFQLAGFPQTELERLFMHMPWEILAHHDRFLAGRADLKYNPVRRIGKKTGALQSSPYRLAIMFMAAAPDEVGILNYEDEEVAILDATGGLNQAQVDLYVEESGNCEQLARELGHIKGVDVLHLSCHGTDATPPELILETETGAIERVTAAKLHRDIRNHIPRLLILSACHSASGEQLQADAFSLELLQQGVPSVIGMADAVGDADATWFTAGLYHSLAEQAALETAVADARFDLLNPADPERPPARDWHLPRLLLRPEGGDVLCNGQHSRYPYQAEQGQKQIFGSEDNPVAGRDEFVGRRRQIQNILYAWRNGKHSVLIKGMGRQGKSSLAFRLASRLQNHQLVVIYKHYHANDILRKIRETCSREDVTKIIAGYEQQVGDNPQQFADCLNALLRQAYAVAGREEKALLLVLDDLEQILSPQPGTDKHIIDDRSIRQTLLVLFKVFDATATDSRLLLTSRFDFALPEQGRDWVDTLHIEHLPPMQPVESRKQVQRKLLAGQHERPDWKLVEECISIAGGNSGLQDWLFTLAGDAPDDCGRVLAHMRDYQSSGAHPDHEQLNDWLENLALKTLLDLLQPGQRQLLKAMTLLEMPVPETIPGLLRQTLAADERDWPRLLALGLCDAYPAGSEQVYMVHPLVRPLAGQLTEDEQLGLAPVVLEELWRCWREQRNPGRDVQLLKLALTTGQTTIVSCCAGSGLYHLSQSLQQIGLAQRLAGQVLDLYLDQEADIQIDSGAMRWIAEILTTASGEIKRAAQCYQSALQLAQAEGADDYDVNAIRVSYAKLLMETGKIDAALEQLQKAHDYLSVDKTSKAYAVVIGDIARIKVSKGEVDAALRLHEERQEVFEQLGDQRERAVTLGDIARIKVSKGEVDAALLMQQERLQIARALGDQDSIGACQWDLAQMNLHNQDYQSALDRLTEAWTILNKTGRVDGLAAVGNVLGQLLCAFEQFESALAVLTRTREALLVLGRDQEVAGIDALIAQCRANDQSA